MSEQQTQTVHSIGKFRDIGTERGRNQEDIPPRLNDKHKQFTSSVSLETSEQSEEETKKMFHHVWTTNTDSSQHR